MLGFMGLQPGGIAIYEMLGTLESRLTSPIYVTLADSRMGSEPCRSCQLAAVAARTTHADAGLVITDVFFIEVTT